MIQLDFSSDFIEKDITKLSVIPDADSFVYGLFDHNDQLVKRGSISAEAMPAFAVKWQNSDASVHYMSTTPAFSFVPENTLLDGLPELNIDRWTQESAICLYEDKIPGMLNCSFKHISSASNIYFRENKSPLIWLHFTEKQIYLSAFLDGKFRFYNQFEIAVAEDVIYYVHTISNQVFSMSPEDLEVSMSGQITVNSPFYQLMYRYIKNISTAKLLNFRTLSDEVADHVYFDHYLNITSHAHH